MTPVREKNELKSNKSICRYRNLLKNAGIRVTRQRLALARVLFENDTVHASAEALHAALVRRHLPTSLSSTYRGLRELTEAGLLQRIPIRGSTA